jgi:hypothetical protein
LYMAAREIGFPLPKSVPWYTVFSSTWEDILDISAVILQLYRQPKLGWLPSLRPDAVPEIDGEMGSSSSSGGNSGSSGGSGSRGGAAVTAVVTIGAGSLGGIKRTAAAAEMQ